MKLKYRIAIGFMVGMSALAAARDGNIQRGGLGFLFPDFNSFANPGQFATSHGMAVEAQYETNTKNISPETATPTFVYGNGMLGLGAGLVREAPDVTKSANAVDLVEAGLGLSLIKERLTVGASYARIISTLGSGVGVASGTVTLNGPNRHGFSLGGGYSTTMNSSVKTQTITGGLGWSFRSNNSIEADVLFNDTNNFKNYNLSGFFNVAGNVMYAGGGYTWLNMTSQHEVLGRIGATLGMHFDFSVLVGYIFQTGNPITYGASLRFSF